MTIVSTDTTNKPIFHAFSVFTTKYSAADNVKYSAIKNARAATIANPLMMMLIAKRTIMIIISTSNIV